MPVLIAGSYSTVSNGLDRRTIRRGTMRPTSKIVRTSSMVFTRPNSSRLGPLKRLGRWVQCWEEDRDADDHPNDNKA
ncbi:hypothetical protein GQ44DRAFT_712292 [Phaeosphaeriaceae sp. PMI808]|nr:hypothetical protein GQ44DRAFT_712292 [Phaeosphaeriaceae sp. PMI808]